MRTVNENYRAIIDPEPKVSASCKCANCGWVGPFSDLSDIQECALTPGDASPAGRCPNCDMLAYVQELTDVMDEDVRIIDNTEEDKHIQNLLEKHGLKP